MVCLDDWDSDIGYPLNAQIFQDDVEIDASLPLSNTASVSMIRSEIGS